MAWAHAVRPRVRTGACRRRYILWEAEEQGLLLPYACRMGCCTACAVRIKEGEMYQPQVTAPMACCAACLLVRYTWRSHDSSVQQPRGASAVMLTVSEGKVWAA